MLKKHFNLNRNITLKELVSMLPFYGIMDGLLVIGCVIYGVFCGFDWRLFSGIFLGTVISIVNFYAMGRSAQTTLTKKDSQKATRYARAMYGIRFILLFLALALILYIKIAALFTLLLPLFYPKLYYTITVLKQKSGPFRAEQKEESVC